MKKCNYGIEDIKNCNKCISDCAFNTNSEAEIKRKDNIELINEYKRLMNIFRLGKEEQNAKHKSI